MISGKSWEKRGADDYDFSANIKCVKKIKNGNAFILTIKQMIQILMS